jgi:hypothetical protein
MKVRFHEASRSGSPPRNCRTEIAEISRVNAPNDSPCAGQVENWRLIPVPKFIMPFSVRGSLAETEASQRLAGTADVLPRWCQTRALMSTRAFRRFAGFRAWAWDRILHRVSFAELSRQKYLENAYTGWPQLILPRDAAQIGPNALLHVQPQPGLAAFGAEDNVVVETGEGIGHGVIDAVGLRERAECSRRRSATQY